MVTLSETHITYNSWKNHSGLYPKPEFTFILKCPQNGEGGCVGLEEEKMLKMLKWKVFELKFFKQRKKVLL